MKGKLPEGFIPNTAFKMCPTPAYGRRSLGNDMKKQPWTLPELGRVYQFRCRVAENWKWNAAQLTACWIKDQSSEECARTQSLDMGIT